MSTYSWIRSSFSSVKTYIATPKDEEKENTTVEMDPFEVSVNGPENLMKLINTKWALTVIKHFTKIHDGYLKGLQKNMKTKGLNSKIKNPENLLKQLNQKLGENLEKAKSLSDRIKKHNFHLNFELENAKTKDQSSSDKITYDSLPRVLLVHEFEFLTRAIDQSWQTPPFCRLDQLDKHLKVCKYFELMKCLVDNIKVTNAHDTIMRFDMQQKNNEQEQVFDDWLHPMDFGYYKDLQSMYDEFVKNVMSKDNKQAVLKRKVQRAGFALPIVNKVIQKCDTISKMDLQKIEMKIFKLLLEALVNLQSKLKENVRILAKNNKKIDIENLNKNLDNVSLSLKDQRKLFNLNRQY